MSAPQHGALPDSPREPSPVRVRPRLPILFEDRWLVVIDKPAGLASVPSSGVTGRSVRWSTTNSAQLGHAT